jgi:hypothetical protein
MGDGVTPQKTMLAVDADVVLDPKIGMSISGWRLWPPDALSIGDASRFLPRLIVQRPAASNAEKDTLKGGTPVD